MIRGYICNTPNGQYLLPTEAVRDIKIKHLREERKEKEKQGIYEITDTDLWNVFYSFFYDFKENKTWMIANTKWSDYEKDVIKLNDDNKLNGEEDFWSNPNNFEFTVIRDDEIEDIKIKNAAQSLLEYMKQNPKVFTQNTQVVIGFDSIKIVSNDRTIPLT